MSAARSAVVQPAPTLEHAPSPSAGSHGTPASAGQRAANSGRSPRNGWPRSTMGPRCSTPSPRTSRMPGSQRCAHWSKRPVPDAIETLVRSSPKRRSPTYSPNDTQRRTRAKRGRVALAEPPEPRREIGRVQPASDPRVVRLLVDPRAERLHRADAPRVRPGVDGRRRAIVRPETEHACARRCWWRPPPPRRPAGRGAAMRASSVSAVSANSRSASISTPPSGVVVGSYGCWRPRSSPRPSRSKASARTEDEPTSSATRIGSAGGGATRTRSC